MLVHRIVVRDLDQLIITEALRVRNVCEIRVTFFAVLADRERVIQIVFLKERLRVFVAVNADLGHRIEDGLIFAARLDLGLEPW